MVKLTCAYCNSLLNEAKRAEALSSSMQSLYVSYRYGASLFILAMFIGSPQLAFFKIISKKFFFSILMFTFVPNLTNIIVIMKKLTFIDFYFCKVCGYCEFIRNCHLFLKIPYHKLISEYLSNRNKFWLAPLSLSPDDEWWIKFQFPSEFSDYLKLIKKRSFWKDNDWDYLFNLSKRLCHLKNWISYYYCTLPF